MVLSSVGLVSYSTFEIWNFITDLFCNCIISFIIQYYIFCHFYILSVCIQNLFSSCFCTAINLNTWRYSRSTTELHITDLSPLVAFDFKAVIFSTDSITKIFWFLWTDHARRIQSHHAEYCCPSQLPHPRSQKTSLFVVCLEV